MRKFIQLENGNRRYDIDPQLVADQIEFAIKQNESRRIQFKNCKSDTSYVDPMIDRWNDTEINHYSKVRIIKLSKGKKRYVLVYGDIDDNTVTYGTGPFETIEKAKNWFLKNGR